MLQVITGKPGTGKTYHAVNYLLLPQVVDWCKYEDSKGEKFARSLYTNLPLNLNHIDKELCSRHNLKTLPSNYINFVELKGKFWESIPDNSLLVFDEVHHALGAEVDGDLSVEFRNYVSTHRHKHHDIILLTQHIENVTKDILRMAEEVSELQNVKTGRIPYFQVPLADVYAVLRVYGYSQQTYIASYGRVVGRAIKWENRNETFFINKKDFGFYDTHVHGSAGSSDAPDLGMSKIGVLKWFAKKHLGKVFFRVGIIFVIFFLALKFIKDLPEILQNNAPSFGDTTSKTLTKSTKTELKSSKNNLDSTSSYVPAGTLKNVVFAPIAIINKVVYFSNGNKYRLGDKVIELNSVLKNFDAKTGVVEFENEKIFYIK